MSFLPDLLQDKYKKMKPLIRRRLREFRQIPEEEYFYEMCFCVCTPQSKAENAWQVQQKLKDKDFLRKKFDPTEILFDKTHYIRFHNQKAKRLLELRENYSEIKDIITSEMDDKSKRIWLRKKVNGFGMKESSHFLRNIGYKNMGILDRHILKHLVLCGVYKNIPNINGDKRYFEVEKKFVKFSKQVGIPLDELDLLFWSYETGIILK